MIVNLRTGLDAVIASAPQLTKAQRWNTLVRYIIGKIIAAQPKTRALPPSAFRLVTHAIRVTEENRLNNPFAMFTSLAELQQFHFMYSTGSANAAVKRCHRCL